MKEVIDLVFDPKEWTVTQTPHKFYHREHQFCEICGNNMHFALEPRSDRPFSGWTKNKVYNVVEKCSKGCQNIFIMEAFENNDVIYSTDFQSLEEKINYMLEKGDKRWKNK